MMNGIEILSIIEKPILLFNETAFFIAFAIFMLIFLTIGIYAWVAEGYFELFMVCLILGLIASFLLAASCGAMFSEETDEVETSYKVTISDEVSLNEFLDKYEIIDQEGKIYTVRERE